MQQGIYQAGVTHEHPREKAESLRTACIVHIHAVLPSQPLQNFQSYLPELFFSCSGSSYPECTLQIPAKYISCLRLVIMSEFV
jgi:hypothetical protein